MLVLKEPPAAADAEEIPHPMPSSKKTAGAVPVVVSVVDYLATIQQVPLA